MSHFDKHQRHLHEAEELKELREIKKSLSDILRALTQILLLLKQKPHLSKGKVIVMPKTIEVGQTAQAVLQGVDQNGNPFPLDASYRVQPTASNPADVESGTPNPDGSFVVTALAVDPADMIGAQVTRPDGTTITFDPDTLTIEPATPVLTTGKVVLQ